MNETTRRTTTRTVPAADTNKRPAWRVVEQDSVEAMRELAPDSVDAVVTDPPYGIGFMGKAWDGPLIEEAARADRERRGDELGPHSATRPGRSAARSSSAFGGRSGYAGPARWGGIGGPTGGRHTGYDGSGSTVPGGAMVAGTYDRSATANAQFGEWVVGWAREALRVLKPGGHLVVFGSPRTYHRLAVGIEDAGFEIRDCLMWLYGSGFPKSRNLSGDWEGWGTALKPGWEPIVLARKAPAGSVEATVLRYGTGALHIDATRVPVVGGESLGGGAETETRRDQKGNEGWERPWMDDPVAREAHAARVRENVVRAEALGRWPANVVLSHAEGCRLVGARSVASDGHYPSSRPAGSDRAGPSGHVGQGDLEERVTRGELEEVWDCVEGCPVADLDRGSGDLGTHDGLWTDRGGASRFFYCAKVSTAEREAGLDAIPETEKPTWSSGEANAGAFQSEGTRRVARNVHPTVKPIDLMRWLVRLVTPRGGIVLDPFVGSGTTGIAATLEGMAFVGVDREAPYVEIARGRIAWWERRAGEGSAAEILVAGRDRDAAEAAGQEALW